MIFFSKIRYLPEKIITYMASASLEKSSTEVKNIFMKKPTLIRIKDQDAKFSNNLLQYKIECKSGDKYTVLYTIFKLRLLKGKTIIFVNNLNNGYK